MAKTSAAAFDKWCADGISHPYRLLGKHLTAFLFLDMVIRPKPR